MPIHKSEDYKLSAVEYYLTEDKTHSIIKKNGSKRVRLFI
jgi:hypothetical protein